MTLEQSLISSAPNGVSIVHDLPGCWLAIVAKHPAKRGYVDYLKHPSETLMNYGLAAASRYAN